MTREGAKKLEAIVRGGGPHAHEAIDVLTAAMETGSREARRAVLRLVARHARKQRK